MHTTTPMEMYKKIDRASDPQKVWHSSKTYYVNVHVQTNCNKNQPDLNVIRHPSIIHRPEQKKRITALDITKCSCFGIQLPTLFGTGSSSRFSPTSLYLCTRCAKV